MTTQVALITGASRGLGVEVARAYARSGLRLILTARGADPMEQAAAELAGTTDVVAFAGDVAGAAHAERAVGGGLDWYGRVDVLINNTAAPGVDLSHLPAPSSVAPAFVRLLDERAGFGRYEANQLAPVTA